jgi:RHS repeat-associated protein
MIMPDGSKVKPEYNEANLLEKLRVAIPSQGKEFTFVENIDYNAKGQREKILYGNSALTTYEYDEKTFLLSKIRTTRKREVRPGIFEFNVLQELSYTYDPVSNICEIEDNAHSTLYFNNEKVDPVSRFEYDALYRLIQATGREYAGQNSPVDQFDEDRMKIGELRLTLGDNAMQNYKQLYEYDEVGNMLNMIHSAGKGIFEHKWTREFRYNEINNQLKKTTVGSREDIDYLYDAHGNMENLQRGSFILNWDYADQLKQIDLGGGGIAYYVYDSSGQRVRKVIETVSEKKVLIKERIYLGSYELYREQENDVLQLERETLHIMDDQQRIALVETRNPDSIKTDPGLDFLIRYQYSNHLGTSCLEMDGDKDDPQIISYEEYYPYGSTAYQAMRNQTETPKRYRYTGKERDEESGLGYHQARYYAPWLGRWMSCDPAPVNGINNLYIYARANPIHWVDLSGNEDIPWWKKKLDQAKIAIDKAGKKAKATAKEIGRRAKEIGEFWVAEKKAVFGPQYEKSRLKEMVEEPSTIPSHLAVLGEQILETIALEPSHSDYDSGSGGAGGNIVCVPVPTGSPKKPIESEKTSESKMSKKSTSESQKSAESTAETKSSSKPVSSKPTSKSSVKPKSKPSEVDTPNKSGGGPGKWVEVARRPGRALDIQSKFSGKEIWYKNNKALIKEYELDGVRFDRFKDNILGEVKDEYGFLIKMGSKNAAKQLQQEAARHVLVAQKYGLKIEWYVRSEYVTAFKNVLEKYPQIKIIGY